MAGEKKANTEYVKKETLWLVSFVSLAIGFLLGLVFSVYRLQDGNSTHMTRSPQHIHVQPDTNEQAKKIPGLEEETSRHPGNVNAWIELGNAYFDTGQVDKAIEAYTKSLQLDPKNADVLTDLGVMYRRKDQPEKAVESFDRAIQIDPEHEIARFNKGVVLMHELNDPEGAVKAWEELLHVNPLAMTPSGEALMEIVANLKKKINQKGGKTGLE